MTGFAGIQCDECGEHYIQFSTPNSAQVSPTSTRYAAALNEGWRTERVPGGVARDICVKHPKGGE